MVQTRKGTQDFIESERSKIDNSHSSKLQFLEKELELSQDCLVWMYEKYLKIEERWNKYDDLISSVDTPENTVYYNKTLHLVSKLRDEIHEMKLEYIEDMSKRERILKEKEKSLDKELKKREEQIKRRERTVEMREKFFVDEKKRTEEFFKEFKESLKKEN